MTAVILGGGVSGLSSAYYLARAVNNKYSKIIVLEATERLGGWMQTKRNTDGSLFETGPRSFRTLGQTGINTLQLVDDLGYADSVIGASKKSAASQKRRVYVNDTLHLLPSLDGGLIKLLFSKNPLLNRRLMSVIREEMKVPALKKLDEDINSFFTRRFGKEFADYLINPMCRGIYAGDVKTLSARSCFEKLYIAEKSAGSIVRGLFVAPNKHVYKSMFSQEEFDKAVSIPLVKKARRDWSMWSFKNGVQQLIEALENNLERDNTVEIRKNTPCIGLRFRDDNKNVVVSTPDGEIEAEDVISSIYAKDLGQLLPRSHQELAKTLYQIPAVSCVVVNFQFAGKQNVPEGFGHLLPSFEDGPTLGVIYDSCTFKEHNGKNADTCRLTVMLGGAWYDELVDRLGGNEDDESFVNYAQQVLEKHLHITDKPLKTMVSLQRDCIPQYNVGHHERLHSIFKYINDKDLHLTLVGSSYEGVSLNDCIYYARLSMQNLTEKK